MSMLSLHKEQAGLGLAVTPFVTEYRHRSKQQKDPFTIEVEYLRNDKIKRELCELVSSYKRAFMPKSKKDIPRIEKECGIASYYTLRSMFGEKVETTMEFLRGNTIDSIVDRLQNLAGSIPQPKGGVKGKWKSTAQTAEDCNQQVGIFMEEKFRPWIKTVRSVSSTSHIFSSITHVIFAESILKLQY